MEPENINIAATFYPDEGKLEEILALIKPLVEAVHAKEPDVLIYYAMQSKDSEGRDEIIFIERYKNKVALDAHVKSEHYLAFAARLPQLAGSRPAQPRFSTVVGGFHARF